MMNAPGLPRATPLAQQREVALRSFIRRVPELAATADSISAASLEIVVAQMSEIPLGPRAPPSRRRFHHALPTPMPPLNLAPALMPRFHHLPSRAEYARKFTFDSSKFMGSSEQWPAVITDSDDCISQTTDALAMSSRYPLRSRGALLPSTPNMRLFHRIEAPDQPATPPIMPAVPRYEPPMASTLEVRIGPRQASRLEPVERLGSRADLAIVIDSNDDEVTHQDQSLQKPVFPVPTQNTISTAAALGSDHGDKPRRALEWHHSGLAVPTQDTITTATAPASDHVDQPQRAPEWRYFGPAVPMYQPTMAAPSPPPTRRPTKKERKAAAAKLARQPAKVKKTTSKKQKIQQELQQLRQQVKQHKKQEKKLPSTSAGTWKETIGSQVSQVRQHFLARAQHEMEQGGRSYPVLIEGMKGAIADLEQEEKLWRGRQRAQPVQTVPTVQTVQTTQTVQTVRTMQPALQPVQAPLAPPMAAAPTHGPEARTTSTRKFWKLPVKFVAAGMAALKHHMDHVDDVNSGLDAIDLGVNGGDR